MRPHRWQPTRLLCPCDSPGKNTGVGCHFLLQGMKVKSESEVAQSCPTLSDPMDCSPPGSSIRGIFQARLLEWGAITFSMLRCQYSPNSSIKYNAIPVKISTAFFMKMDKLILKFIRNCKGFCLAIIILKKNKVGGHISGFKIYY